MAQMRLKWVSQYSQQPVIHYTSSTPNIISPDAYLQYRPLQIFPSYSLRMNTTFEDHHYRYTVSNIQLTANQHDSEILHINKSQIGVSDPVRNYQSNILYK